MSIRKGWFLVSTLIVFFGLGMLISGCGGGGGQAPAVLTTIEITPSNPTIEVGQDQVFSAIGKDQYGDTMVISPDWEVTPAIGSFDVNTAAQVTFSSMQVGTAVITASVGDVTGTTDVTVSPEPPELAKVEVSPDPHTLEEGETAVFTVTGYDQYDNTIAISATPSWSVTGGIGTVSPAEGLSTTFTAVTAGSGTVAVAVASFSDAATVTVTPAPIYVPDDYGTIQGAIDASSSGDVIIVRPGTYYEHIDYQSKDITVRSTDPLDPDIVASTIIDGSTTGTESVVRLYQTGSRAVLEGFTITGGTMGSAGSYSYRYGSGIFVVQASPIIRNNVITGNTSPSFYTGLGGGIYVREGAPTIQDNQITWNQVAATGGGLFVQSLAQGHIISGNIISNNTAQDGGGVGTAYCAVNMSDNTIQLNTASRYGGAVYHASDYGLAIDGCTITNNQAVQGGGIWLHNIAASQITSSSMTGNVASQDGGGIFFWGSTSASLGLTNTTIDSNSATDGGGVYLANNGNFNYSGNTFAENNAYAISVAVDAILTDGGGNTFRDNLPSDIYL